MNDPWNTLVEVLAGRPRPTPSTWAQRRVHRMCDDLPPRPLPPTRTQPRRPGAFVVPQRAERLA